MSYFAEIDASGIVKRVIVANQKFINSGKVGHPKNWVETSYETHEGVHKLGGIPLRKNYAGIGYTYDKTRAAFIPPKPYGSWVLSEEKCVYEPPVPFPTIPEGMTARWNEAKVGWDVMILDW